MSPVHGAPAGGDLLQHLSAFGLVSEGVFKRFELPAYASDTVEELCLVADCVSHRSRSSEKVIYHTAVQYNLPKAIHVPGLRNSAISVAFRS